MRYKGHVKNGTVVLDEPVALPEGTRVEVAVAAPSGDEKQHFRGAVMAFAGKVTGLPEDASTNVDHYLYGHPKQ
jgi:hypothetical protein